MAYPTNIDFKIIDLPGAQPVTETSTTQKHPLGQKATAQDYGTGARGQIEVVYAKGVASTVAGSPAILDFKGPDTTLCVSTSKGNVGVAMSANVASQYGWYAVRGCVPVHATSGDCNANEDLYIDSNKVEDTVAAGAKVDGMVSQAAESGDFAECMLHYPCMVGNGDASGN